MNRRQGLLMNRLRLFLLALVDRIEVAKLRPVLLGQTHRYAVRRQR